MSGPLALDDGDHLLDVNGAVQWLGVRGARLATVPLVVVHGGPGAHNWVYEQSVGTDLARHRTLVLHEQRGCGRAAPGGAASTAASSDPNAYSVAALVADLHGIVDALGVPEVDLLGWSFGADLVTRVALERPHRVRRLVLQAPALDLADPVVPAYLLRSFLRAASPLVREQVAEVVAAEGDAWDRVHRLWPVVDAETADRVGYGSGEHAARGHRLYEDFGIGTNMDMLMALTAPAARACVDPVVPRLAQIRQPTLVMAGARDRNVDPERVTGFVDLIPDARLAWFPNAGHMLELEEPEGYARQLLEFLSSAAVTER